ncbi:MAG: thioredoxin [Kineosporiaceae bacterium]
MAQRIVTCGSCATKNRVPAAASGVPRCASCKAWLPWIVDATDASFDTDVATKALVLVDLWAAWCGPCRMVAPVLEQLASRHAGRLKVVKVDVDANRALSARFQAQSIPLLVVLSDGEVVERIVGAQPFAALDRAIAPHLASTA